MICVIIVLSSPCFFAACFLVLSRGASAEFIADLFSSDRILGFRIPVKRRSDVGKGSLSQYLFAAYITHTKEREREDEKRQEEEERPHKKTESNLW